ncbi:ABC transporter ATP-binding protein [Streptosporangium sandarakinum]|uniref:ABC transporter ATP-binding protein n=1 Tax=Streptosporangium nondiastaticum TaxID=35764 RepID=UPI003D158CC6
MNGAAARLGSLRRHASRLGGFRAGAFPRHPLATLAPSSVRTPAAPSQAKIGIRNVGKVFRTRGSDRPFTAVTGVDLDVREGEFLTLVGPSGCGKSTLLDLIAGLTAPTDGEILIDGRAVDGPGLDRGIVFQQYALLPWRTALANIEFGLEAKAVPRRERRERARHYLDLVGLAGFEHRYPHELSGGMRQRVAIARSLAFDPDVLLMDEPFAALDAQTRESLQEELLRVWEKTHKTVVFITHGIDEAVYLGQRVAVMTSRPGRIKEIVDVRFDSREGDLRADPVFGEYRHHIWSLLRNEVAAGREQERTVD